MITRMRMIVAGMGLALAAPVLAASPITGRWVTGEKDAVVAIAKCGKSLCGRIEKFLILPPGGKDQRDVNNSDPAKRGRKLIGTAILYGLTEDDGVWRGQVYDPKSGRTYTSEVRGKGDGSLEVKGCFGPICQTQVWKRAS
ncbi:DUF2147 domain-containing protein [Porphyrobacter sp. ULC335]|nr:DUF2147 domain-containing protein [Porphyrobacter sp. ULC335]